MRVVIGPVDAGSARAWLGHAHRVLDGIGDLAPGACFTAPDTVDLLRGFLDSWSHAALGAEFYWEEDLPAERIEYAMHAFQRVVDVLAQRAEVHGRGAPPEGDEFYLALLMGVFRALEAESASSAAFAEHLAETWPGWVTLT